MCFMQIVQMIFFCICGKQHHAGHVGSSFPSYKTDRHKNSRLRGGTKSLWKSDFMTFVLCQNTCQLPWKTIAQLYIWSTGMIHAADCLEHVQLVVMKSSDSQTKNVFTFMGTCTIFFKFCICLCAYIAIVVETSVCAEIWGIKSNINFSQHRDLAIVFAWIIWSNLMALEQNNNFDSFWSQ